jgi:fatty acid desaturase
MRTLLLIVACYGALMLATSVVAAWWLPAGFVLTVLLITLHSSLQHEALHGHPTRNRWVNELLVFPAVGLFIPYGRFRDTHLAHHHDEALTDPYDDPESNYLDPAVWGRLNGLQKAMYRANNTLIGRMVLGPLISEWAFLRGDIRAVAAGNRKIPVCWSLHLIGLLPVIWWLSTYGAMPAWAYILAAYLGLSVLKIRTFLEHRAFEAAQGRTVVVEDRGPLAFLFLNNNYHIVHHSHPGQPWYRMQKMYFADPDTYLTRNSGYRFRNYGEVFARFLVRAKDPVPHPLRPGGNQAG